MSILTRIIRKKNHSKIQKFIHSIITIKESFTHSKFIHSIIKNMSRLKIKTIGLIFCCLLFWNMALFAQDENFTVSVYPESILMGNQLEVQFKLENVDGSNFQAPQFEGFYIVGGPNQSSSFSMINGETSRSLTYTYYLEPKEEGNFYIEPASVDVGDKILSTLPVEIIVEANPDGIRQEGRKEQPSRTFDFFNIPEFSRPIPKTAPEPSPKTKPKKKRKIYRI